MFWFLLNGRFREITISLVKIMKWFVLKGFRDQSQLQASQHTEIHRYSSFLFPSLKDTHAHKHHLPFRSNEGVCLTGVTQVCWNRAWRSDGCWEKPGCTLLKWQSRSAFLHLLTAFAPCSHKWAVFVHAHRACLMDAVWVGAEVSYCFQVSTFCWLLIAKSNGQWRGSLICLFLTDLMLNSRCLLVSLCHNVLKWINRICKFQKVFCKTSNCCFLYDGEFKGAGQQTLRAVIPQQAGSHEGWTTTGPQNR